MSELTEEQIAEIRSDLGVVEDHVGHGEAQYNGPALCALSAARKLLAEVDRLKAELKATKNNRLISAIFGHHKGAPRPFALYRREGTVLRALGAEFPDGAVALRLANDGGWTTSSYGIHDFVDDETEVVWLSDELESLAEAEQEIGLLRARVAELDARSECTALCRDLEEDRDEWQARAERMTPVVEAAKAWRVDANMFTLDGFEKDLIAAVDALGTDAGEAVEAIPEHGFDERSVLNPVTGKPYGPGLLWAGTEPMDYPEPLCHCGEPWDTELDGCAGHTNTSEEARTYLTPVLESLTKQLPDCPADLIRYYALLALVEGVNVTREHVHDAWALWQAQTNPGHRSLIPFAELSEDVQRLDAPYAAAIRVAALEEAA